MPLKSGKKGAAIRIILLFALLILFSISAYSETYYMANESCSDSWQGNETYPFCTFHQALSVMSGGDTLFIADGIYKGYENTFDHTHLPPSGFLGNFTSFVAENPGEVIFDGEGVRMLAQIDNVNNVSFDGLIFRNSSGTIFQVIDSQYIKIMRCGFVDSGDNNNVSGDSFFFRYVDYGLIEDSYIWGNGRYKFYILDSNYVILRRCVVRADRGKDVGYSNQGSYRFYAASNSALQNCISIDESTDGFILTPSGDGFIESSPKIVWIGPNPSTGYHGANNTVKGFIALNNRLSLTGFIGNNDCANNQFTDSVFWDCASAMWTRSENLADNITTNHCTFGLIVEDGYHDHAAEADFYGMLSLSDSIVYGVGDSGVRNVLSDYNCYYNNSYNFQTSSEGPNDICSENSNEVDPIDGVPGNGNPALEYILQVESDSDLSGSASDGGDIGANILNRTGVSGTFWGEVGWNKTTYESLWPFPNENVIKEHMQTYFYTNGTHNVSGNRGFAAEGTGLYGGNITLTSYIWEYLGNPCPEEICTYDSPYNDADLNTDNIINTTEVRYYITEWIGGSVQLGGLSSVIDIWKNGGNY